MLTESYVTFFCCPEPFKLLFCEVIYCPVERERRENKGDSKTVGSHDLVQFKLELMPNHQNSNLENTGI